MKSSGEKNSKDSYKVSLCLVDGSTAIQTITRAKSLKDPNTFGLVEEGGAATSELELHWDVPRKTYFRKGSDSLRIFIIKRHDGRDAIFGEVNIKMAKVPFDREFSVDIKSGSELVGYVTLSFSSGDIKQKKAKLEKQEKTKPERKREKEIRGGGSNSSGSGGSFGGPNRSASSGPSAAEEGKELDEDLKELKKALNSKKKSFSKKMTQRIKDASLCGGTEQLDLSEMNLELFPAASAIIDPLPTSVKELDASFNQIVLTPDFSIFSNLTTLNLNGNKLTRLSSVIGLATSLTELSLIGNQLVSVSKQIRKIKNLEKLNLSNNNLEELDLMGLPRMDDLNVSGNRLKAIPWGMRTMELLTTFDISGNQVPHLSSDICGCTRLIELNVASNKLEKLPDGIGNLTRVCTLNIADNRVSDLPYSIGKLPLSYFDISRNPIKDPKIIEKFKIGTDHLQSYLELRGDLAASDQKRQRKIEQQTAKREPSPPRKRPEKSKKDGLAKRKNPEIRLSHEGRNSPMSNKPPPLLTVPQNTNSPTRRTSPSPIRLPQGSGSAVPASPRNLPPKSLAVPGPRTPRARPSSSHSIPASPRSQTPEQRLPVQQILSSSTGNKPHSAPHLQVESHGRPSKLSQEINPRNLSGGGSVVPPPSPRTVNVDQVKQVIGLCKEHMGTVLRISRHVKAVLVTYSSVQQLMQIAGHLKFSKESFRDLKQLTPDHLIVSPQINAPTTRFGEQFNTLLRTLLVLCNEIESVITALSQYITSLTREYLTGTGDQTKLRVVVQAGKLTRTLAQSLQPLDQIN